MNTLIELHQLYDSSLSIDFKNRIISHFLDRVFDKKVAQKEIIQMVELIYQNINRSCISKDYFEYDPNIKNIYSIFLFSVINNLVSIVEDLLDNGIKLSSLHKFYDKFIYFISFDVFKKLVDYGMNTVSDTDVSMMLLYNKNEISDYCFEHGMINTNEIIRMTLKHNAFPILNAVINRDIKIDMTKVNFISNNYGQNKNSYDRINNSQFKILLNLLIEKGYNLNQLPIFKYCYDRETVDLFMANGFDIYDKNFIDIFKELVIECNYTVINILFEYDLDIKYLCDQLRQDNENHNKLEELFEAHHVDFNKIYVLCQK